MLNSPNTHAHLTLSIPCTVQVFQEDLETAKRAGINEFMCKPFKFPVLEETMIKFLKGSTAAPA